MRPTRCRPSRIPTALVILAGLSTGLSAAAAAAPVDGVWVNSYGSLMRLETYLSDLITGCYSSTTGASGAYHVVGSFDPVPNAAPSGTIHDQASIAIALPWRSYLGGDPDTSWHWTSTMAGMYYQEDVTPAETVEKIQLINALDTTTIDGTYNPELGLYPETLNFTRYADQTWQCPPDPGFSPPGNGDPVTGHWDGPGLAVDLTVGSGGQIYGNASIGTSSYWVDGFFDYDTTPTPIPNQVSISLVISTASMSGDDSHSAIALTGDLDPVTETMKLYTFKTFGATTYTSVVLGDVLLSKSVGSPATQ